MNSLYVVPKDKDTNKMPVTNYIIVILKCFMHNPWIWRTFVAYQMHIYVCNQHLNVKFRFCFSYSIRGYLVQRRTSIDFTNWEFCLQIITLACLYLHREYHEYRQHSDRFDHVSLLATITFIGYSIILIVLLIGNFTFIHFNYILLSTNSVWW